MKFLIVVDMQNDFISGALGSVAAEAIVEAVVNKVKSFDGTVIFTRDTHAADYLNTREGRHLPVEHCIENTYGWQICDALLPYAEITLDKPTFGSMELTGLIRNMTDDIEHIELVGLCTDICVISNAMLLKAAFPEVDISVDSSACAGVTTESHLNALNAMRAVQIEIS